MFFKFFIFFLCLNSSISLSNNNVHLSENICSERLMIYSEINSHFFRCATQNAEPVKFCQNCIEHFVNATISYKNLTTKVDNINCKDYYIDLDRLNIVNTINLQVWELWNKGFCQDCFDWNVNINLKQPSNDTLKFYEYLDDTENCIKLNYGDACVKCSTHYLVLNDFYNRMSKEKENKICFDIQDNMNKTRLFWSKEMSCCKERKSSFVMFTIISSLFSLIPVIFYCGFYYHSIRIERMKYISNDISEAMIHSIVRTSANSQGLINPTEVNNYNAY